MANPKHLKILEQGVEVWNRWREENPDVRPNLEDIDLENANLDGANLRLVNFRRSILQRARLRASDLTAAFLWGADLRRARMQDVILQAANLETANLWNANLIRANLRVSNLQRASLGAANFEAANLQRVNLWGADLRGAILLKAELQGANLHTVNIAKADFKDAGFASTTIGNTDLSQARSLGQSRHSGPSSIGVDSLKLTAAGLSDDSVRSAEIELFLRSAGLDDEYIDLFQSFFGQPIQFYSCFISYSHADKPFARRLHDQFQAQGIRCWLDEHDLKPGDRILDVVDNAIRLHDRILLCCSETSLNSWWVKDEIEKALQRERREDRDIIIPLNLDGYLLERWESGQASAIRSRLAADFAGWEHDYAKFEEQFEQVVKALRTDEGIDEQQ